MDNRQHGLFNFVKKLFQKKDIHKPKVEAFAPKPARKFKKWRQGGGMAFGRASWRRSKRLWEMNLPKKKKMEKDMTEALGVKDV